MIDLRFSKARVVAALMVCYNCVKFYEGFLDFNDTTQCPSLVHLYVILQTIGCGNKHKQIL
jgi:hypothetical protein